MKSSAILRVLLALLLALVPAYAPATAVAGEIFNWTGESGALTGSDNWTELDNWDDLTEYPGQNSASDEAIIDDDMPRDTVVQNDADLTIAMLFVGHGHTLQLDEPLDVVSGAGQGEVRLEGTVIISGDSALEGQWVWVNSREMDTSISVTGTATVITNGS